MRFKALHVPHCHPFKHGFYLTGAQPAPSFAEQAVRTPARAGMTAADARRSLFLFIRHIVLKHRPEPDIIRPSTSVKIFFLTGQTDIRSRK
ncbi:hypothetical protein DIP40_12080 [Neisseria gonorrhoeae]